MPKLSTVVTVATLITAISTLITIGYSARVPIASLPSLSPSAGNLAALLSSSSSTGKQVSSIPIIDVTDVQRQVAALEHELDALKAGRGRPTGSDAAAALPAVPAAPRRAPAAVIDAPTIADEKLHLALDGRLIRCDAHGHAFNITMTTFVNSDPLWEDGRPVACRADMFYPEKAPL
ncbi:hypothetical protein ACV22V_30600 [Burkholderia sp. AW33-5]